MLAGLPGTLGLSRLEARTVGGDVLLQAYLHEAVAVRFQHVHGDRAELGTIVSADDHGGGRALVVRAPGLASTSVGDSVSINGCCLTAESVDGEQVSFRAVSETLARTTLGQVESEDRVNVEPAVRAGDLLGGHYVQGHVDGVGRVQSVEAEGEGLRVFVEAPDDVLRYCVEKGSVTIDGVSLTVAARGRRVRRCSRPAYPRGDDALGPRPRPRGEP